MGTIAEKLQYMINAVDDIQMAINENHVETGDDVVLGLYGEKIRQIKNTNGNSIKDYYIIEKFVACTASDLITKDIEDVSDRYEF